MLAFSIHVMSDLRRHSSRSGAPRRPAPAPGAGMRSMVARRASRHATAAEPGVRLQNAVSCACSRRSWNAMAPATHRARNRIVPSFTSCPNQMSMCSTMLVSHAVTVHTVHPRRELSAGQAPHGGATIHGGRIRQSRARCTNSPPTHPGNRCTGMVSSSRVRMCGASARSSASSTGCSDTVIVMKLGRTDAQRQWGRRSTAMRMVRTSQRWKAWGTRTRLMMWVGFQPAVARFHFLLVVHITMILSLVSSKPSTHLSKRSRQSWRVW